MILLAEITVLTGARKTPVGAGYCPTWVISTEDDTQWSARAMLEQEKLGIGETCQGVLQPQSPSFWLAVKVGDVVTGYEGRKATIEAKILKIFLDRNEEEE